MDSRYMRYGLLGILALTGPTPGVTGVEQDAQPTAPGSGQLLVASRPAGLSVYIHSHEAPPRDTPGGRLSRTAVVDDKPRGQTPLTVDLKAGVYTVAVEQAFDAGSPDAASVPRGCVGGFSFAGSTVFFKCFKCNMYPDQKFVDPLDPYERDGNVGACFDAPQDAQLPVRYFRIYALTKTDEAANLKVALSRKKNSAGQE